MRQASRKWVVVGVLIVAVVAVIVGSKYYGLDIGKFFAAELGGNPPLPTPAKGQIVADCVMNLGKPMVRMQWSALPPSGIANSNSIQKGTDTAGFVWFFGGNLSSPLGGLGGVAISGARVCGSNPCQTVKPNMTVHDLRDSSVAFGHTYSYRVKYTTNIVSNTVKVAVNQASCGALTPTPSKTVTPTPSNTLTPTPTISRIPPGTLTLTNGSNLASGFVLGGTTRDVYSFMLAPQGGDFRLSEASVQLIKTDQISKTAVAMAYLYDGSQQIGTSPFNPDGPMLFTGLNRLIPQAGGTKTLSVRITTARVGVGMNATNGDIKMGLVRIKYLDVNGDVHDVSVDLDSHSGNDAYVVRSFPSFTNLSLPSTVLAPGTQTLFKTMITAAPGGDVSYKRVVFSVSVSSAPTLESFKVFENGSDITSLGTMTVTGHNFDAPGAGQGTIVFTRDGTGGVIAAGSSSVIELRATVTGGASAGQSIATRMYNASSVSLAKTYAEHAATPVSIIWSDNSAAGHSLTTADWFGDGLIKALGDSESLYQ